MGTTGLYRKPDDVKAFMDTLYSGTDSNGAVRRVTLATAARKLDKGKLYMVTITGHVVTLKDGIISDQYGPRPLAVDRCGRKYVKDILREVDA